MSKVRTILCVAGPGDSESAVEQLRAASAQHDVDAIALVGDLSTGAVDRPGAPGRLPGRCLGALDLSRLL
jgi:hypothetical protein